MALALLALAPTAAEGRSLFEGSDVVEYEPRTFNATVLSDPRAWIVVYYADWCGHCIHYSPVFKRMASELIREKSRLRLGALNCAMWDRFCTSISVRGYPTVRAYHLPALEASHTKDGADVPREIVHSEREFPRWVLQRLPNTSSSSASAPATAAEAPGTVTAAPPGPAGAAAGSHPAGGTDSTAPTSAPAPLGTAALRLVDAEVALLYSLRHGTFLGAKSSDGRPARLQGAALEELRAWLDFLAAVLPSRQACEDLRSIAGIVARAQASATGALEQGTWSDVLDGQGMDSVPPQAGRDPAPYWRLCKTYTCGLWALFHIVTIATAEGAKALPRGFLAAASRRDLLQPPQALVRLRGFVANFFGCLECARNFVQMFDSCDLGRCKLDRLDGAGAALWLWQVHNGVTRRISTAEGGAAGSPPHAWPPKAECGACWVGPGEEQWDAEPVYRHLRASFWQPDWLPGGASPSMLDYELAGGLLMLAALGYFVWSLLAIDGRREDLREKGS